MQKLDSVTADFELGQPKKMILLHLKRVGKASLGDIAKALKVSKMAAHKHVVGLEQRGLVESSRENMGKVGRPRAIYELTNESKTLFPRSYSGIALCALQFVERKMGRDGVEQVLRERQGLLFDKHKERLRGLEFGDRIKELTRIRDEEGYMAETKRLPSGKYVMLEHNCPVIQLAQEYWEACSTETELFQNLLGADVEATHRAAKGDLVCRFVIKERA